MDNILRVIYTSLLAFLVLFIISKLLGKKQVAQLEFTDYVVGISIGSIAAQMAVDGSIPFYHFIIAMAIFGVIDLLITIVGRKAKWLKKLLKGNASVIIEEGKINYKNLKKTKIDINELLAQCRAKGYFYLENIEYCIFETSGDFSILGKSEKQNTTKEDLNLLPPKVKLNRDLIIDGKVIHAELKKLNKDENWLMNELNIFNKKEFKNFIYCAYNINENKVIYFSKNASKKTSK